MDECKVDIYPDSKVHGANMGPIWGRQDPGGPHVGPINFAIWVCLYIFHITYMKQASDVGGCLVSPP